MATSGESEAKLARDAQFERFDGNYPVGGAYCQISIFCWCCD